MVAAFRIDNWDDAYANASHIPDADRWPGAWQAAADAFRSTIAIERSIAYGPADRETLDWCPPLTGNIPRGVLVFVHGGYWMKFDSSFWTHLAAGALAHGFAVALPSYPLCPAAQLDTIASAMARAVETVAARVDAPLYLAGHSAGGQLLTRLCCTDTPLTQSTQQRIRHVMSISGVHDLRPLLRTSMNHTLKLDVHSARAQSPALCEPLPDLRLTCWVGGSERAEFVRQSALLCNLWRGLGSCTELVIEPDRHHFDVIDALGNPDSAMVRTLLA